MQDNAPVSNDVSSNGTASNALKNFQLNGNETDKTSKKFGEKIVLQVDEIIRSGHFTERNLRFALNRAMFTGRMNITKFMDFFDMNGMTNYTNINWKSIMIVNTIISRLVGRWMTKRYKASITAVDDISIKKKKTAVNEAEFYMNYKDQLRQVSNESGVQMIPQDQFIPDDKDHLDIWAEEELRVPEEILMETGINGVFDENGWGGMGINTRKHKVDAAVVGLIGKETIADKTGKVRDIYCKPEDMFYSYSEQDDFSDASIKGVIISYKLSDLRYEYPDLSMPELLEIAKTSKQWNASNKITYDTAQWHQGMFLPIDDWNVDVVRFTLRSLDVDRNLIKTATDGSLYVDKPKKKIEEVYPGNEYVEKTIWNIYRGVYVRETKKILEWGLERNIIRPQDYGEIYEAKSPFSFYMYQNDKMRNLAIPEKIEEPVEGMILSRLKIQQLVAEMIPAGFDYDIDGLQAMDLGNGICTPLELRKVTKQTGDTYHRSKDAEGNRIENPIRENPNAGSVAQLQELIEIYNHHLQVLRDEVGINEFAEGQTIKPRTGVENVQTSLEISFNATDYINDATVSCADESADKIACLLHDSIEFGSKEYRDLMGEQDVKDRNFKTKIEMLPTIEDITEFDNSLTVAMNAQPDLVMYIDPAKLKRMAKKNVKLAERYFYMGQRRAIEGRQKLKEQDSQMNAQNQQQAGIAVEKEKQNTLQMELDTKKQLDMFTSQSKKEEALITLFSGILSKGLAIPPEWKGVESEMINNLAIPLFAANKINAQAVQDQTQAENEQQEQGQEQPTQQNPQEQMQPLPTQ